MNIQDLDITDITLCSGVDWDWDGDSARIAQTELEAYLGDFIIIYDVDAYLEGRTVVGNYDTEDEFIETSREVDVNVLEVLDGRYERVDTAESYRNKLANEIEKFYF